jgi:hypothetical protein
MTDERDDEARPGPTRRRFLRDAAGLAALGVSSLVVGRGASLQALQESESDDPTGVCEDCGEAALPLLAAAFFHGGYHALAPTSEGPGLFLLDVDGAGGVSLGAPIALELPEGFWFGSLGVSRGALVLTGGLPFLWDQFQMTDEEGAPQTVDVEGLRPAAFQLDPPVARPMALPPQPKRRHAMATKLAETSSGAMALLIEHCGRFDEARYASAVDVLEERGGLWSLRATADDLGESRGNHLAAQGEDVLVVLNAQDGVRVLGTGASARLQGARAPGRVLGLISGEAGIAAISQEEGGARLRSVADGTWTDRGALPLQEDRVVRAVTVGGTKGQSILLGLRSAVLVDESSALRGLDVRG